MLGVMQQQRKINPREVIFVMKEEKKVNMQSALARKLAKILSFGTKDFNRNVKKLSDKINSNLPEDVRPIPPPVIKSWIFTAKYPLRKNLVVLARALEIDPDVLQAPEKHDPVNNAGTEVIDTLDATFTKLLPYFRGKYIKIDGLEHDKVEMIHEIIKMKEPDSIAMVKQAVVVGKRLEHRIDKFRGEGGNGK